MTTYPNRRFILDAETLAVVRWVCGNSLQQGLETMKTFCPNCECERETTLYAEVRECTVCREGFEIVCGTKQSNSDVSTHEEVLMSIKKSKADEVMEIIHAAVSGDCQKYLNYDLAGNKYCKWGVVERDIRAILEGTHANSN